MVYSFSLFIIVFFYIESNVIKFPEDTQGNEVSELNIIYTKDSQFLRLLSIIRYIFIKQYI